MYAFFTACCLINLYIHFSTQEAFKDIQTKETIKRQRVGSWSANKDIEHFLWSVILILLLYRERFCVRGTKSPSLNREYR